MNQKMLIRVLGTFLLCAIWAVVLDAQCPMCRMAAETNLQNGGTEGKGLNTGILYILALPYAIVATIGFIWWRNRRRSREDVHG